MNEITALILCGGESKRMGEDKGLINISGKCLVEYVIANVKNLCSEIIIVSNNPDYAIFGYDVWKDVFPSKCPMNGIYTGLLKSDTKWNLVLSCDAPFASPGLLTGLINNIRDDVQIVTPFINGRYEPLLCLYSKDVMGEMEKMLNAGDFSLVNLIQKMPHLEWDVVKEFRDFTAENLLNINSRGDLEKFIELIESKTQ
jgi:molybdenum cofactor guanylyltransferase